TRLTGPCPAYPVVDLVGSSTAQGGRAQDLYLQVHVDEGPGGCGPDTYNLSVQPLPDGVTTSLDTTSVSSASADNQTKPVPYAILHVSVPATVAQTANAVYQLIVNATNTRTGQVTSQYRNLIIFSATATLPLQAPPLRLVRPVGWVLTNQPP